jgi:hypothetical protein
MDDRATGSSDWSDIDLLTRGEAVRRLTREITLIDERRAGAADPEPLDQRLAALRRSLAALGEG